MIKFYQGTYAQLGEKVNSPNNICFVERNGSYVLMMGGKEYGKDGGAIKIESTFGLTGATGTRDVVTGTLFAFQGDQSLWRYDGTTTWTKIFDPTLSAADFIATISGGTVGEITYTNKATDSFQATALDVLSATSILENKVKDAYTGSTAATNLASSTNTVVVSKPAGIERTEFVLNQDRDIIALSATSGVGAAVAPATQASAILVTEKTLAEQTTDILANGLEIRKFQTAEAGYRASYGLFNKQTGGQLGDTINIIKDQFLRDAAYVAAYKTTGGQYIEWGLADDGTPAAKPAGLPDGINSRDQLDRYLKLTFALPATANYPAAASGTEVQIEPDSSDVTYTGETDTSVYINVNELFDSYTGASGVIVNKDTNVISARVDPATESGLASHYNAAFLTVGADGLKVNGIKEEITGYIQDLTKVGVSGGNGVVQAVDQVSGLVGNNMFLTMVGVDANGVLTGQAASGFAKGINYEDISGTTALNNSTPIGVSGTTVQDAINVIAQHIGALDGSYDGDGADKPQGADTQFIYAWTQTDGKIATSAKAIDASNLKANIFQTAKLSGAAANTAGIETVAKTAIYVGAATGTGTVQLQDALTSLAQSTYDAIAAMDLNLVGKIAADANNGGTANIYGPDSVNATTTSNTEAYRIVNTVKQSDGNVYANDIEYSAPYIYFSGIAAAAGSGDTARVAVGGMSVDKALNSISNTIAKLDYAGHTEGSAPTSGGTTKFTITKGVTQTDGLISETTVDLTAANIFVDAINGNLPSASASTKAESDVRVAILADSTAQSDLAANGKNGSVQQALDNISNILADYLSFHDWQNNVI